MKKLILLLIACAVIPAGAMMQRPKPVDIQPMLKQLKDYEKLDFSTMNPSVKGKKSDEVNNLIGQLKDLETHAQDRAKIDKAIKHYEDVQTKKEQAYRKALKEQEPLEAR